MKLLICLDDKGFLEGSIKLHVHVLVNKIFNDGKYPTSWKTELIRPVHKKKEETYLEKNYRGINLISCLGKFLARCIPWTSRTPWT